MSTERPCRLKAVFGRLAAYAIQVLPADALRGLSAETIRRRGTSRAHRQLHDELGKLPAPREPVFRRIFRRYADSETYADSAQSLFWRLADWRRSARIRAMLWSS